MRPFHSIIVVTTHQFYIMVVANILAIVMTGLMMATDTLLCYQTMLVIAVTAVVAYCEYKNYHIVLKVDKPIRHMIATTLLIMVVLCVLTMFIVALFTNSMRYSLLCACAGNLMFAMHVMVACGGESQRE